MDKVKEKILSVVIWIALGIAIAISIPSADAEEYINVQVDIGKEFHPKWQKYDAWDGDLPFEFTVAYYNVSSKGWFFTSGYSHQSNVLSGPPFNDDKESVLDKVYIGFGKKFMLK